MEWMLRPLKRYAEFSGRSRRMEFWMWLLFQFLIGCVFVILVLGLGGSALMSGDPRQLIAMGGVILILYLLYVLLMLAFFVPSLAVTIRRLHDSDRSGWWVMLYWGPYLLIILSSIAFGGTMGSAGGNPTDSGMMAGGALGGVAALAWLVGCLVLVIFLFFDGTPGPNKYGPDPKGRDAGQVFA
ncbi:MAG: hypothetical protein QOJ53_2077 [Sphingomonadales bacterium]|jgi:uncharacterized membrane protein YhaH (DUF805 family)|nr:hypothetical protein [Sphingomonadales bacterium]MEA3047745.1 hypothetical protein [Sphingomonadales bacterium]